ncbi:IclR family transcriptional regulator [Celeribacter litoreus]|uniref:IclR family transcriptional regulator n=1 Tax=Celeribacter litoreus TaxID=2876714 RepID=UPI001CCBECF8|nr:IclR family transcriptional regulator [Celeribacter litoreus]MCA0042470.1 IclR family transcriptional regulator [Celeribacter litoreus]
MTEPSKRRAPAAERTVLILDRLAASPTPLGVSELARDIGAPKSSVYGICETLVETGVLHAESRGYSLSAHCLRWSGAYLNRSSLVSEFQRILAADCRLANYTVTLSTLEEDQVVYLACRNSNKPLGFTFQIGMRLPAAYSATGKAMLSHVPVEERHTILSNGWDTPFTENSVSDLKAFDADAEKWRAQGYAVDDGEIREGMVCLGAPVLGPDGAPIAGIAISMTSAEARPDKQKELGEITREIANMLARHYTG